MPHPVVSERSNPLLGIFMIIAIYFPFSSAGVELVRDGFIPPVDYTWCFVDAAKANVPRSIFRDTTKLFPVYVTWPEQSNWVKFEQLRLPKLIVMNPWTINEMKEA